MTRLWDISRGVKYSYSQQADKAHIFLTMLFTLKHTSKEFCALNLRLLVLYTWVLITLEGALDHHIYSYIAAGCHSISNSPVFNSYHV